MTDIISEADDLDGQWLDAVARDDEREDPERWERADAIRRDVTRSGKFTKERVAQRLLRESDEFIGWFCKDDAGLRRMVEELRSERKAGTLF